MNDQEVQTQTKTLALKYAEMDLTSDGTNEMMATLLMEMAATTNVSSKTTGDASTEPLFEKILVKKNAETVLTYSSTHVKTQT